MEPKATHSAQSGTAPTLSVSGPRTSFCSSVILCLTHPMRQLSILACTVNWWFLLSLQSMKTPRSLPAELHSSSRTPVYKYIQDYTIPSAESGICPSKISYGWWLCSGLIHQDNSASPLYPQGIQCFSLTQHHKLPSLASLANNLVTSIRRKTLLSSVRTWLR